MSTLTRYVTREFVQSFLVCLAAIAFVMLLAAAGREILDAALPLSCFFRLLPYLIPDALRVAIPVAILLASAVVYGRMAASNELVAAKSLGIHPLVLLMPAFVVAFLASLGCVWLNDLAAGWSRPGIRRVVVQTVEQIVYRTLEKHRSYRAGHVAINVRQVAGRRLILPTVTVKPHGDQPAMTITAAQAELSCDAEKGTLKILLDRAMVEADGWLKAEIPGRYEQVIPIQDANDKASFERSPSWLATWQIDRKLQQEKEEFEQYKASLAAQVAFRVITADFGAFRDGLWKTRLSIYQHRRKELARLVAEPYRRWATGFSCLFFVLVGAPLAIRLRNKDFLTSFFLCFLPIIVVYYPLLAYTVDGAKSGALPCFSVWAANLLLAIWAALLLRKVLRY